MFGQCSICQEFFTSPSEVSVIHCGHIFHQHCILQWFERASNCPKCRKPASEKSLVRQIFVDQPPEELQLSPSSSNYSSTSAAFTPQKKNVNDWNVGKLRNKISDLENTVSTKDSELKKIRSSLTRAEKELKSVKSEQERLRDKLTNSEGSLQTLREQLSVLESLKAEKKRLDDLVTGYKRKLRTYAVYDNVLYGTKEEAARAVSKYDVQDLPTVLDVLKGQYEAVREEKKKMNESFFKAKEERRRLEAECAKSRKTIKELREEIKAMQQDFRKTNGCKYSSPYNPALQSILENSTPVLSDPSLDDGEAASGLRTGAPLSSKAFSALINESTKKENEAITLEDSPLVVLPGGQTSKTSSMAIKKQKVGLPSDGLGTIHKLQHFVKLVDL